MNTHPLSYYACMDSSDVLKELKTSEQGLSEHEAHHRLHTNGLNVLVEEKKSHWFIEYISNFKNPLVLILLIASLISFSLGQILDAVIIACIIIFSTTLNFFQEHHAGQAAKKLQERVANKTAVVRDGKEEEITTTHVCVGDVIVLHAGDIVPADARVFSSNDFFVNQSSLTGESFPVEKTEHTLSTKNVSLSDLNNCIFSGSSVVTGTARAVVVQIGKDTEFGKIAQKLNEQQPQSEFTTGINTFSMLISRITVFFVLFIFLFTIIFKHTPFFESFTFAIAIAVGLTPELLPMIMSLTMAKGSLRMAQKGVIVKKLASIPDFGEMDILCTDKTGTLTEDNIELVQYMDVEGKHSEHVLLYAYMNSFFQTGIKNPMDEAVIRYKREDIHLYKKVDEIPFDFERKKMSVIFEHQHGRYIVTKGAPEEIFHSCSQYQFNGKSRPMNQKMLHTLKEMYTALSNDGYRVLGIATKKLHDTRHLYSKKDEVHMAFLGFIAFLDPPKKGLKDVLADLEHMGIEVKVITGDSELVTQKICHEVNLPIKEVLLGRQIEKLTDDKLRHAVERTSIFARCSPNEKNRILIALKQKGHVVGYMGDGINDAPSLRTADVGISVNNAVDVAKESADMILTHKSLQQLKDGVIEGRKTFGNTMKYIMMGISSNFGNMFSVLAAVIFLPFIPMLPLQILLNNLLYDVSQMAIPTDNVDKEYILRPKKWDMSFIKRFMFTFGPLSSLFDFVTFYTLYSIFHSSAAVFQTGWFLESLATQTLIIHIIRTRYTPFVQSRPSKYLLFTTLCIVLVGWMLPYIPVGKFFGFTPLSLPILIVIFSIVIVYSITVELTKKVFYMKLLPH